MYHTKNFFRVFLLTAFCVLTTVPLVASSYSRGMSQFMRKNYDEARTLLNQAVEEDPSNGNAYYYLGEIEKNTKNYPTAIDYYLKALDNRLNQKYVKLTYWNLIILTEQRNDLNAMVKTCKSFYRKTGDRGAMEKVNSLINKMLWTNNQDAISEYNLGKTALASNRTEDAAGHFRNALREDSSFLAPRFELGMIAHKNGDVNEAVQQLHVIADRIPFYTSVQQLTADMYMKLRAWSNAKRYYTNIIEYGFINQETLRSVLIRRSQSSFQLRRYSDAEDDILRAQAIRETAKPKTVLSAIYIKQRRYDDALAILKELDTAYPNNPDIDYQIGSLYYKKGDKSYRDYFRSLYGLTRRQRTLPDKYLKVYLILANDAYSRGNMAEAAPLFSRIPGGMLSYDEKIAAASSFYDQKNYMDARDILSETVLTDRDKLLLSRAYVKTGELENARAVLKPIVLSSPMKDAVMEDPVLKQTADSILEEEQRRQEEEERRRQERLEEASAGDQPSE